MSIECLCRPVFGLPEQSGQDALWAASGFRGNPGQTLMTSVDGLPVLLVGLGQAQTVSAGSLREAAALAAQVLAHVDSAGWDFHALSRLNLPLSKIAQSIAEGATLGSYKPGVEAENKTRWQVPVDQSDAWSLGLAVGRATARTRDLVNSPPNVLTPGAFAAHCGRTGKEHGLTVKVLSQDDLVSLGFGGILAIGGGSSEPSLLIEVTHVGASTRPDLSLVGKGVTFDSGGLSLKGAEDMIGMKHDMAGAAAVFEAMTLLPLLAPDLHVKAYLPVVENLPGQGAARPGDVVTMRNGRTVEILNTDFEGRVILADALAYASEEAPAAIIDLATLTNAAIRALGERTAALLSSDKRLGELVRAAAESSDEPVWELPMPGYLGQQLKSDIADYKNFPGTANARALTAAMFLRVFIPDEIPWAHLDIAGPAWAAEPYGLTIQGGTGFGVRLLADLFQTIATHKAS
jgi:leucyl aminopeptidase